MFQYLKFKKLYDIEIIEPTKNTIILCNNKDIVFRLSREMEYLIKELVTGDDCTDIDYALTDDTAKTVDVQVELFGDSLSIFSVDDKEQQIIITTEISNIQLVQDIKDLWFIDIENNVWDCYALTDFERSGEYQGDNLRLIKAIRQGKFGCYEKYGL